MIVILAAGRNLESAAAVEAAFPNEPVITFPVGGGEGNPDGAAPGSIARVPASTESLRVRMSDKARGLINRAEFGPLQRVLEQAAREAQGMAATPLDRATSDAKTSDLDRLLALVDDDESAVVVCLDRPSRRLGWQCAQSRPDRLVLAGPDSALAILGMLEKAGLDRHPSSVRQALGAGEVSVRTYPFPELRRAGRPRVVSLVSNTVDGDSRVQKVAASLAELGYESILLGRHPLDDRDGDHYMLGGALVVRLPVPFASRGFEREAPPRTPLTAMAFRYQGEAVAAKRHARAQARRLSAEQASGDPAVLKVRVAESVRWITGLRASLHLKNRRRFFSLRGDPSIETSGRWNRPLLGEFALWAIADDFELAYGPYLESLRPDVIHAHDSDTLSIAMTAAGRLRAAGHDTRVVYDAHEYTPGTARYHSRQSQVLSAVERRFVPSCDAVVTVSNEIADLLLAEHNLQHRPAVVLNAPTRPRGDGYVGIRQRIGQPSDTPLLVYVGGVAPQRGVDLAVAALPDVPDAHLVVVAPDNGQTQKLLVQATALGVADRFHRLDYVPADEVVDFVASCDVGLIPFRPLPNSELGVPTKYREYLVARLPIVASDQGLVAREIRDTGVGELFPSGDARGLASAINKVLGRRDSYRSAITSELIADNVWPRQVDVIERVYADVSAPPQRQASGVALAIPSVLIGRTNAAGQASAWAGALRRAGVVAHSLHVLESDGRGGAADVTVRADDWQRANYRLKAFVDLVPQHTHVLVEHGVPLFGGSIKPLGDVDALLRSGLSVGLVFHGSDVRRPLRHARRERWSPFNDAENAPLTAELEERTARLHAALARFDGPILVSTPDLLDDVPWAEWLPFVVDTECFCPDERNLAQRQRPVVVHTPNPSAVAGTKFIAPVLRELDAEQLIEYRPLPDVPHSAMPNLLRSADIVVDQVLMNSLAVSAVEAMACGRVVVSHVDHRLADRYGAEHPVIDATPDTLEQSIRDLVADPERIADLGRRGREFAVTFHDGRMSARVLATALGLELRSTS